ncbi:abnormal cell lineage protein 23 [Capsaspora owczarzaki ATCC 30864]|uniref:Abnormal cell lineage protein 23 n=1 Tax=Capsaspora owczarzaki (strain ATCC 30864) TaxID=595528 RepID=A0A0D2WNP9_CAPO3|nr:abnormal cell lineage protein 23 [Capsaspora owczarzaki ATCC 30864]KJE92825.1 abnormal cell lineage protein 23 [Capsaspora owczarzaki ATCC 30864]|eukprot:XP_004363451.2 abnormal cell lineage protein 23 [Capsaspora owczarzaki ATCC 30864]
MSSSNSSGSNSYSSMGGFAQVLLGSAETRNSNNNNNNSSSPQPTSSMVVASPASTPTSPTILQAPSATKAPATSVAAASANGSTTTSASAPFAAAFAAAAAAAAAAQRPPTQQLGHPLQSQPQAPQLHADEATAAGSGSSSERTSFTGTKPATPLVASSPPQSPSPSPSPFTAARLDVAAAGTPSVVLPSGAGGPRAPLGAMASSGRDSDAVNDDGLHHPATATLISNQHRILGRSASARVIGSSIHSTTSAAAAAAATMTRPEAARRQHSTGNSVEALNDESHYGGSMHSSAQDSANASVEDINQLAGAPIYAQQHQAGQWPGAAGTDTSQTFSDTPLSFSPGPLSPIRLDAPVGNSSSSAAAAAAASLFSSRPDVASPNVDAATLIRQGSDSTMLPPSTIPKPANDGELPPANAHSIGHRRVSQTTMLHSALPLDYAAQWRLIHVWQQRWNIDQRRAIINDLLLAAGGQELPVDALPVVEGDMLSRLPSELRHLILTFTDQKTLRTAAQVCKAWHAFANENLLWRVLYEKQGYKMFTGVKHSALLTSNFDWKREYRIRMRCAENWRVGLCGKLEGRAGHTGSVLSVQFSLRKVISGSSDHTIRIWDLFTGDCQHVLEGHRAAVLQVRFDDRRIVSCSKDYTVRVWDVRSLKQIHRLEGHQAAVNGVQFNDEIIVSASGDRTLRIWSLETGVLLRTLTGHLRGIVCLHLSGDTIVSGSSDFSYKIWNVRTGECQKTLTGHTDFVRAIQKDGTRIVSGSYDRNVLVWNADSGEVTLRLTPCKFPVLRLQFDDTKIIIASQDKDIRIVDFVEPIPAELGVASGSSSGSTKSRKLNKSASVGGVHGTHLLMSSLSNSSASNGSAPSTPSPLDSGISALLGASGIRTGSTPANLQQVMQQAALQQEADSPSPQNTSGLSRHAPHHPQMHGATSRAHVQHPAQPTTGSPVGGDGAYAASSTGASHRLSNSFSAVRPMSDSSGSSRAR